jgi:hypothetical protein
LGGVVSNKDVVHEMDFLSPKWGVSFFRGRVEMKAKCRNSCN